MREEPTPGKETERLLEQLISLLPKKLVDAFLWKDSQTGAHNSWRMEMIRTHRLKSQNITAAFLFVLQSGTAWAYLADIEIQPPYPIDGDRITVHVTGGFLESCWAFMGQQISVTYGPLYPEIKIDVQAEIQPVECEPELIVYEFAADIRRLPARDWHLTVTDPFGSITLVFTVRNEPREPFKRGDANADGNVEITDAIATLSYLFRGEEEIRCGDAADANDDGELDISDPILTLEHLFLGGVEIPAPGPNVCGLDPTADAFVCRGFAPCVDIEMYDLRHTGGICVADPCFNLIGRSSQGEVGFSYFDLTPIGLNIEENAGEWLEFVRGITTESGWKVKGYFIDGPHGTLGLHKTLVVLEVLGRVEY